MRLGIRGSSGEGSLGRQRRGGGVGEAAGKPRARPGPERGEGRRPGQGGRQERARWIPGQRGGGRSAADPGVDSLRCGWRFSVGGEGTCGRECWGLGTRRKGWICGFQPVAGARCAVAGRNPWVQVAGLRW